MIPSWINTLRQAGYTRIIFRFDGGGDSGDVHDHDVEPADAPGPFPDDRLADMYEWAAERASDAGDWYNNDGGFGHVDVNLENLEVEIESNYRYTSYNTEYDSLTLEADEDEEGEVGEVVFLPTTAPDEDDQEVLS